MLIIYMDVFIRSQDTGTFETVCTCVYAKLSYRVMNLHLFLMSFAIAYYLAWLLIWEY